MKRFSILLLTVCFPSLLLNAQETAPSPAGLEPLPEDGAVTLEQIVSDFRTDPVAADKKYGGNQITVTGRVGDVENAMEAGYVLAVYLQEYENTTPDVKCLFARSALPEGATVSVDDTTNQALLTGDGFAGPSDEQQAFVSVDQKVSITGDYDQFIAGNIVLKNCTLD